VLLAALDGAKARRDCPCCANKEWKVWENVTSLTFPVAEPVPEALAVAALGLTCTQCGFVRFHAARTLEQYRDT
jgi:hypothetical protein